MSRMARPSRKTLLIGYGNPGRCDDGLGPALAEAVARAGLPGVTVESDYQLTVEDAAEVADHDAVIFADAAVDGAGPFEFRAIEPAGGLSFSTHSIQPEAVLGLARDLFGARTCGYVLGIRGYEFDTFCEDLSRPARSNLDAAADFILDLLRRGGLEQAAGAAGARQSREPQGTRL